MTDEWNLPLWGATCEERRRDVESWISIDKLFPLECLICETILSEPVYKYENKLTRLVCDNCDKETQKAVKRNDIVMNFLCIQKPTDYSRFFGTFCYLAKIINVIIALIG